MQTRATNQISGNYAVAIIDFATMQVTVEQSGLRRSEADGFCDGYNRDEEDRPSQLWAVAVPSTTTGTTNLRDSAVFAH